DRRVVDHERGECLLGVEDDEIAEAPGGGDVDQTCLERSFDRDAMLGRGDHDGGLSRHESFAQEPTDGLEQLSILAIELNRMVKGVDATGVGDHVVTTIAPARLATPQPFSE